MVHWGPSIHVITAMRLVFLIEMPFALEHLVLFCSADVFYSLEMYPGSKSWTREPGSGGLGLDPEPSTRIPDTQTLFAPNLAC